MNQADRMTIPYDRTCAVVDLDAVCHNMEAMKKSLPEGTGIIGRGKNITLTDMGQRQKPMP